MTTAPGRPARAGIATPHVLATDAGAAVLADGGTAVDAAIAAAAVLCVVYPNNVALGSDLVALVALPDGRLRCVNASGPSPAGLTLAELRSRYGAALPLRGADTISVPGGVRGWGSLLDLAGSRPLDELLGPAITAARSGVPVARSVGAAIRDEAVDLDQDAGCRETFLPSGHGLEVGDLLAQPRLADSLEALAAHGVDEFYTGDLATTWLAGLRKLGSALRLDDLESFRPEIGAPLTASAFGFDIHTSPPNTQGFALLRTLTSLPSEGGLDPDPAVLARAFLAANDARDAWLADPRQAQVDLRRLLTATPPRLDARAVVPHGDTVGISTVSADGCAVSLIQSVFHGFGSCVLEPASGILFQNRGTSFSLDPSSPNVFAPGKRPRHTLMPVVVTRPDGRLAWVSSTMGGQGQPQIHSQVLLRAMAGADPAEAVAAPRFVVGQQDDGDLTNTVTVESDAPAPVLAALAADPVFEITSAPPHDELLGHANLIALDDGAVSAGSDPRADGSAVVLGSAG